MTCSTSLQPSLASAFSLLAFTQLQGAFQGWDHTILECQTTTAYVYVYVQVTLEISSLLL